MSFLSRVFRSSSELTRKPEKSSSAEQKSKTTGDGINVTDYIDFDTPRPDVGDVTCVKILLVGAGSRGQCYAYFAVYFPKLMKLVGVADPRSCTREELKMMHEIDDSNLFEDWKEAAAREKFADAVVIATPDRLHKDPAIAFARKGYHILLEKPMAVTPEDCREIVSVCKEAGVMLAVGHVMRYHPVSRTIKELIDSGAIGDVIHIQHMEPIGHWHFAHSFVRGNWRNEKESTFSLLAKSCHDIDLICYWTGKRCVKVSSFGTLSHFTKENKPKDASSRCLDCSVEENCPYSAKKIYLKKGEQGNFGWPVAVVCNNGVYDIESLTEALRTGPYGRCVYECDNDVVSNQVVNMEFEGGLTAAFTMMAFTNALGVRSTTIYGSKGELRSVGSGPINVFNFATRTESLHPAKQCGFIPQHLRAHGGADYYLMSSFISAVGKNDPSLIQTGPDDTLRSHLLVFEAEKSRKESCVVHLETNND
ncbi:putative oxidoreductase YteT [Discoglossus pictus]